METLFTDTQSSQRSAVRALASEHEGAVLYINVAGLVAVAVANGSGCLFTSASAGDIETIASGLAERRGLTLEHARAWMRTSASPRRWTASRATRTCLRHPVGARGRRARARRQYSHVAEPHRTQDSSETVELGVGTGATVSIPGFVERLGEQLRLPLEARVIPAPEDVDAGRLTVAAGLVVAQRS